MRKWQHLLNNMLKLIYKIAQVHNNILKLKRWTRCRWEWCLPATKSINVELQKITLPWRPLLSYHSGADSHDRDMIGASYHRQETHQWCSGDLFDTTIVCCSQGYVEEEHPLMPSKSCAQPTCIVSSINDCYGADIVVSTWYICIAAVGILCWAIWIGLFTPSIHKICIKNIEFYYPPTRTLFCIPIILPL